MRIPSGTTNRYIYFVAVDITDLKTRETGLTSFTVYYEIANGSATAMTTPTVTEADAVNMPGVYSLLIDESGMTTLTAGHDTAELVLHITQASMAPVTRTIEIYRVKGTEGETVTVSSGAVGTVNALAAGSITASVIATGAIDADAIADGAIDAGAIAADAITAAKIAAGAIDAATFAADVDAEVRSYVGLASANLDTQLAAIEDETDDIGAAGAGLTAVPWNAAWDAEVQSEVQDALAATQTEGYATDGAAASIPQLLYMIWSLLAEANVSSTTLTAKKLDGSTTSMTFTLDDATSPTSITRTT